MKTRLIRQMDVRLFAPDGRIVRSTMTAEFDERTIRYKNGLPYVRYQNIDYPVRMQGEDIPSFTVVMRDTHAVEDPQTKAEIEKRSSTDFLADYR